MAFGNVQPFYLDTSGMENALSGLFAAQKKKKEDEAYGGLLNSLSGGPGPMPQQHPVNALAMQPQAPAAPSSGNVPASIRYNNPGAMWPGPSSQKFGATGAGVIGGGNKIAQFDSPESGAAAQFDLLARKYAGKPLGAAIAQWSGGNSSPAYAASIAKATGLDPNAVLTPDMLRNPSVAVPLAKAMARWEAGREFPLDDNGWTRAHAMAMGGGRPQQAAPQVAGGGNQAAILAWARANPAHPAAQEIARSMAGQALDPTAGIKMQQAQANLQGTLTEQQRAGLEFYGKQAMAISQLPETSPQRAAAWQQLLQRHSAEHPEDEITPEEANPVTGPQLMAAQAGQYLDPNKRRMEEAALRKLEADAKEAEAKARVYDAKTSGGMSPHDPKDKANIEEGMRKEITTQSKAYADVRDAYARVKQSSSVPSPAGDLALIFNYMKMLDPGSVVREAEFATAAQAGSFGDVIQAQVSRLMNGERLSPNMRADFVYQAEGLMKKQEQQFKKVQGQYTNIAKNTGVDPKNVIIDYTSPDAETADAPRLSFPLGDNLPSGDYVWNPATGRPEKR